MKTGIKLSIVVLILWAFAGCGSEGKEESKSQIVFNADEKPLTRLDSISNKIIEDPNNPELYFERGMYFYGEDEYGQAIEDMKRAIAIDSTVSKYYLETGNIYYADTRFENAYSAYQKAVDRDHNNTEAILQLAKLESVLENYQLALSMLDRVLKIDPMNADAYFNKGFVFLDLGDTAKAVSSYRTAIEVNPDHYDSYIMLGLLYAKAGKDYAGEFYLHALDLRPKSVEALYNYGMFLQEQERYEEAYSYYDRIIENDSSAYFAYYNRGYIMLISDSSYTGAIKEFEKALEYYPYYYQALYNIGLCYENLGDFKKAEEYYQRSLEINPQYDLAARGMSRIKE